MLLLTCTHNTEGNQCAATVLVIANMRGTPGSFKLHATQQLKQKQAIPACLPQSISFLQTTYATTRKQLMGQQDTCLPPYPIPVLCQINRTWRKDRWRDKLLSHQTIFPLPALSVAPCQKGEAATLGGTRCKIHQAEKNKKSLSGDRGAKLRKRQKPQKQRQSVTHRMPLLYTVSHLYLLRRRHFSCIAGKVRCCRSTRSPRRN